MNLRRSLRNLTKWDWTLWIASLAVVASSFLWNGTPDPLTASAPLVGVTALIFVAKGDVLGQVLTVVFSLLYAAISLRFRYYGEMITYLGMTAPIAGMSVIAWIRHPFQEGEPEVGVASLGRKKTVVMLILTAAVTFVFYFILAYFHTANLVVSTVSIATSFLASYLMLFRSPAYALAYAANDLVLILLWILASMENRSFVPMVICFATFWINDLYGFFQWKRRRTLQSQ